MQKYTVDFFYLAQDMVFFLNVFGVLTNLCYLFVANHWRVAVIHIRMEIII